MQNNTDPDINREFQEIPVTVQPVVIPRRLLGFDSSSKKCRIEFHVVFVFPPPTVKKEQDKLTIQVYRGDDKDWLKKWPEHLRKAIKEKFEIELRWEGKSPEPIHITRVPWPDETNSKLWSDELATDAWSQLMTGAFNESQKRAENLERPRNSMGDIFKADAGGCVKVNAVGASDMRPNFRLDSPDHERLKSAFENGARMRQLLTGEFRPDLAAIEVISHAAKAADVRALLKKADIDLHELSEMCDLLESLTPEQRVAHPKHPAARKLIELARPLVRAQVLEHASEIGRMNRLLENSRNRASVAGRKTNTEKNLTVQESPTFAEIVSQLGQHPGLMRKFRLVIRCHADLRVDFNPPKPTSGEIQLKSLGSISLQSRPTAYEIGGEAKGPFYFRPSPRNKRFDDTEKVWRLFHVLPPKQFAVTQDDYTRACARARAGAERTDPVTGEADVGVEAVNICALPFDGTVAQHVANKMTAASSLLAPAKTAQAFCAEDLMAGHTVHVWRSSRGAKKPWQPLCMRRVKLIIPRGQGKNDIEVIVTEEATLPISATTTPAPVTGKITAVADIVNLKPAAAEDGRVLTVETIGAGRMVKEKGQLFRLFGRDEERLAGHAWESTRLQSLIRPVTTNKDLRVGDIVHLTLTGLHTEDTVTVMKDENRNVAEAQKQANQVAELFLSPVFTISALTKPKNQEESKDQFIRFSAENKLRREGFPMIVVSHISKFLDEDGNQVTDDTFPETYKEFIAEGERRYYADEGFSLRKTGVSEGADANATDIMGVLAGNIPASLLSPLHVGELLKDSVVLMLPVPDTSFLNTPKQKLWQRPAGNVVRWVRGAVLSVDFEFAGRVAQADEKTKDSKKYWKITLYAQSGGAGLPPLMVPQGLLPSNPAGSILRGSGNWSGLSANPGEVSIVSKIWRKEDTITLDTPQEVRAIVKNTQFTWLISVRTEEQGTQVVAVTYETADKRNEAILPQELQVSSGTPAMTDWIEVFGISENGRTMASAWPQRVFGSIELSRKFNNSAPEFSGELSLPDGRVLVLTSNDSALLTKKTGFFRVQEDSNRKLHVKESCVGKALTLAGEVLAVEFPDAGDSTWFVVTDLKDKPALLEKLFDNSNRISAFLSDQFSSKVRDLLKSRPEPDDLTVVEALNGLIQGPRSLYDASDAGTSSPFDAVMSPKTAEFKSRILDNNLSPKPEQLVRLNRMLLEDAYSNELAKPAVLVTLGSLAGDQKWTLVSTCREFFAASLEGMPLRRVADLELGEAVVVQVNVLTRGRFACARTVNQPAPVENKVTVQLAAAMTGVLRFPRPTASLLAMEGTDHFLPAKLETPQKQIRTLWCRPPEPDKWPVENAGTEVAFLGSPIIYARTVTRHSETVQTMKEIETKLEVAKSGNLAVHDKAKLTALKVMDGNSVHTLVSETIARWVGWSLAVPLPGDADQEGGPKPKTPSPYRIEISMPAASDFRAKERWWKLPPLRYEDTNYYFVCRRADLSGNHFFDEDSLPAGFSEIANGLNLPTDDNTVDLKKMAAAFRRTELPVAPLIAFKPAQGVFVGSAEKPVALKDYKFVTLQGQHPWLLIVSDPLKGGDSFAIVWSQQNQCHLLPPPCAVEVALTHGVFDQSKDPSEIIYKHERHFDDGFLGQLTSAEALNYLPDPAAKEVWFTMLMQGRIVLSASDKAMEVHACLIKGWPKPEHMMLTLIPGARPQVNQRPTDRNSVDFTLPQGREAVVVMKRQKEHNASEPWQTLRIIHATVTPVTKPKWIDLRLQPTRHPAQTDQQFETELEIDVPSTAAVAMTAYWNEYWDETVSAQFIEARVRPVFDGKKCIREIVVEERGSGYGSMAVVIVEVGPKHESKKKETAWLEPVVKNGRLVSVTVREQGDAFNEPAACKMRVIKRPPLHRIAEAEVKVDNGGINKIVTVTDPGGFYAAPPIVIAHDLGGDGYGAVLTAEIDQYGRVFNVRVSNPGQHYTPNTVLRFYTHQHEFPEVPVDFDPDAMVEPALMRYPAARMFPFRQAFRDTYNRRIDIVVRTTSRFRSLLEDPPIPGRLPDDPKKPVASKPVSRPRFSVPRQIEIPCSASPLKPEVSYHMPAFRLHWGQAGEEGRSFFTRRTTGRLEIRREAAIRVYLERPWNVTGAEMLGVIALATQENSITLPAEGLPTVVPKAMRQFISRWGFDPGWDEVSMPPLMADQFYLAADVVAYENLIDDFAGVRQPVSVALHPVSYDQAKELWYADVGVSLALGDKTAPCEPFVQLAIVRYQANGIPTARISNVHLCEPCKLPGTRSIFIKRESVENFKIRYTGAFEKHQEKKLPRREVIAEFRRRDSDLPDQIESYLPADSNYGSSPPKALGGNVGTREPLALPAAEPLASYVFLRSQNGGDHFHATLDLQWPEDSARSRDQFTLYIKEFEIYPTAEAHHQITAIGGFPQDESIEPGNGHQMARRLVNVCALHLRASAADADRSVGQREAQSPE